MSDHCFVSCSLAKLKDRGMRVTKPRLAVLDSLKKHRSGLSAKGLYDAVQQKMDGAHCDPVTVYRIIDVFVQLGVAHRLPDGRVIGCREDHHHGNEAEQPSLHIVITCRSCESFEEKVVGVEIEIALQDSLRKAHSRFPLPQILQGESLCPDCQPLERSIG